MLHFPYTIERGVHLEPGTIELIGFRRHVIETGRPSVPALVNMILMQLELAGLVDSSAAASPIDPVSESNP